MEISNPIQRQFLDYWKSKKADRKAPRRSDMDPLDFHKLLPNIIIYKVHHDPLDYQLTLIGTKLTEVWGKDLTGAYLGEIFPESVRDRIRNQFNYVSSRCVPRLDHLDAGWADKEHVKYSRLLLPLSEDGENVDRVIGCLCFHDTP